MPSMPPSDSHPPKHKTGRAAEAALREAQRRERLAAALRDNLRRRKGAPAAKPSAKEGEGQ